MNAADNTSKIKPLIYKNKFDLMDREQAEAIDQASRCIIENI